MIGITLQRGRYEIIEELGNDGIKVTYLAKDHYLPVTPKPWCIIKQFQPLRLDLFRQKAEVLYKLGKSYDQIPNIDDFFDENLEFYIVEEHIEGHDLSEEITPGRQWNEAEVVRFLQEILAVLAHVHQQGVIHRNIKPSNIRRRDQDGKLFLIDFGIAKEIMSKGNFLRKMLTDSTVGTSGYMPKEQDKGNTQLYSDLYAVGMIALQALTGTRPTKLPIDRKTKEVIWRDRAQVNERLAEVLTKMVKYDFRQRHQSAAEVLQALTQATATPQPSLLSLPTPTPSVEPESVPLLVPFKICFSWSYINGLGEWGYISPAWEVVIKPQFDRAYSFSEGLAAVRIGYGWGYINASGQVVIQPRFNEAWSFSEGLAAVRIGYGWGYINASGQVVIQPQFNRAYNFAEGLAAVRIDDKWGYINASGQVVIQPQFNRAWSFSEGLATVKIDDKWGYIDASGQVVIQPQFNKAWSFSEGLAATKLWDSFRDSYSQGYIDSSGQLVIQHNFDFAGYFSEGLAPVQRNHKWGYSNWGYINQAGTLVIQPQFDRAWSFSKGRAWVKIGNKYGYLDETKKVISLFLLDNMMQDDQQIWLYLRDRTASSSGDV